MELPLGLLLGAILLGVVAYLLVRRRIGAARENDAQVAAATTGTTLPAHVAKPTALVLGDPQNPVVTVTIADVTRPHLRRELVSLSPSAATGLASLLQHAPRVLAEGPAIASSITHMSMVFTPQVAADLAAGNLQLVPSAGMDGAIRAIARDPVTNRFVEHANIVAQLNPVVALAAVWQVAAMVTAQKYLAVINTRLAKIESGVSAIREFLEDAVVGELEGHIKYLRDRAETVREGRISPGELHSVAERLDQVDSRTRGITAQLLRQLERKRAGFSATPWDERWFNANDKVEEARLDIARAEGNAGMLVFAGQLRLLGISLRSALGLHDAYTGRAIESLHADLQEQNRVWDELGDTIEAKLPKLGAKFQFRRTDKRQRRSVRKALHAATSELEAVVEDVTEVLMQLRPAIHQDAELWGQPMELEVEVDEQGRIRRAERVLSAE